MRRRAFVALGADEGDAAATLAAALGDLDRLPGTRLAAVPLLVLLLAPDHARAQETDASGIPSFFLTCATYSLFCDTVYGYRRMRLPLTRQFLHAYKLRFALPSTGEEREFVAPLPDDLQHVLDTLEQESP